MSSANIEDQSLIQIPNQFCKEGFRFIKLLPYDKRPIEKWKDPNNQYSWNDDALIHYMHAGGNYAIVFGEDICVLDVDNENTFKSCNILEYFEGCTFTVKTGRGKHFYFKNNAIEKKFVFGGGQNHIGEIIPLSGRYYIVGPGSYHPNGRRYEIISDDSFKYFTLDELNEIFYSLFKKLNHVNFSGVGYDSYYR